MGSRRAQVTAVVFIGAAAAACLALGWWQWSRFESSSGTAQNLGYAMQWPAFAAFVVYGYRRFLHLEREQAEIDPDAPPPPSAPTAIDPSLLPARPGQPIGRQFPVDADAPSGPDSRVSSSARPSTTPPRTTPPDSARPDSNDPDSARADAALAEYNAYLRGLYQRK